MNSVAMNADARQTDFCVYLSAISLAEMIGPLAFAPVMFAEPAAPRAGILMDELPR